MEKVEGQSTNISQCEQSKQLKQSILKRPAQVWPNIREQSKPKKSLPFHLEGTSLLELLHHLP
nr:hypothetical protein Iba_chr10aCG5920 [Ipomoea batatas]GMD44953.1 hypothetical protein Iba_chr10dCG5430 [Ipomoea batatas]